MRHITFLFVILALLIFCSAKISKENTSNFQQHILPDTSDVLPNGTYRFDIAFAEWEGKSMEEQVTIIIHNDSVTVIYEGDGQLRAEKGKVLEKGILLKHQSGNWIIGQKREDAEAEEIGGCSGGPSIIDFKNKKYWMC